MGEGDFREKPLNNRQAAWMSDQLVVDVRILQVDPGETYAGNLKECLIDLESGEDETWVCLSGPVDCSFKQ